MVKRKQAPVAESTMSIEHSAVSRALGMQGWPKASLFLVLVKVIVMEQETDYSQVNREDLVSTFCRAKEAGR